MPGTLVRWTISTGQFVDMPGMSETINVSQELSQKTKKQAWGGANKHFSIVAAFLFLFRWLHLYDVRVDHLVSMQYVLWGRYTFPGTLCQTVP